MGRREKTADYWAEDEEFPLADWQREVANGSTRASYQAWVKGERDAKADKLRATWDSVPKRTTQEN